MDSQNKRYREMKQINEILNNFVSNDTCSIRNGSITIIKQDDTVIQINIIEKILFDDRTDKFDLAGGVAG